MNRYTILSKRDFYARVVYFFEQNYRDRESPPT